VDQTKISAISPGLYHAASGTVLSPNVVDFTVTLSAKSIGTVTIAYATKDGTAKAGVNYTAASGQLTFAPGVTSHTVAIKLTGNAVTSNEAFSLTLSTPSDATLGQATATATLAASTTNAAITSASVLAGSQMSFVQPAASNTAQPAAVTATPSLADMTPATAAAVVSATAAAGIDKTIPPGGIAPIERWTATASHALLVGHLG
jgi:hypothetical protein